MLAGRSVKPLGGVPLGQNKSVQIVEIGRKLYVLGVGDSINLISIIEDEEEAEYIRDHMMGGRSTDRSPASLMKWIQAMKAPSRSREEELPTFQQVFRQKMQSLPNRKKRVEELIQEESLEERWKKHEE
ncbi:flagellar biosynthetic protein FliO [Paenibacillus sp. CC-CFT747]|nr:flagellar biosynthetic protein FliO [Paenibacillus sp. CC-CFT747]